MSDTAAEIMAKAMWANDADEREWATDKDLEGVYDRYRLRARVSISALTAAGLAIVPVEPTEAMKHAGGNILHIQGRGGELIAGRMFKAMIAEARK